MYWNTGLTHALFNSLLVCIGTSLFTTIVGTAFTMLVGWYRVPGRQGLAMLMMSMILIPVYVQATAWSAGFGVHGWFRLSQVAASISPWRAIGSVVWIQTSSSIGMAFLISILGLSRAMDSECETAIREFGRSFALRTIVMRRMLPWMAVSALWTLCTTNNDMIVTNLFQVPTLTESIYQQVQFNKLLESSISIAVLTSIAIGLLVSFIAFKSRDRLAKETSTVSKSSNAHFNLNRSAQALRLIGAIGIVMMVVGIPLMSLLYKAGSVSTVVNDTTVQSWSASACWNSIVHTVTYSEEFYWSLSLGFYTAILSVCLSILLLSFDRGKRSTAVIAGLLGFAIALPGPVINLLIGWLSSLSDSEWAVLFWDQTLAAPLIAIQFRSLPIAYVVLWIAGLRFQSTSGDALTLDRSLSIGTRFMVWMRWHVRPMVFAFVIAFFTAFSDLSTYLLVKPAQVTTVALRMFELLHYGIRNEESGLAIVLVTVSLVTGAFLLRPLLRYSA